VIVAGNWKMFRGPDPQALAGLDAVVLPPYTRLRDCVEAGLTTYGQNVHWESEGAFTGEISAPMLLELGVAGALVGHSERRQYFGETDIDVARRAEAALDAGLRVIACVGETQEERDSGDTEMVLRVQVGVIDDECGEDDRLVLAYEPVWAIGTGKTATPADAQEVIGALRNRIGERYDGTTAESVRLLYGGSVNAANVAAIMAEKDVDGALVGGASLKVDELVAICRYKEHLPR